MATGGKRFPRCAAPAPHTWRSGVGVVLGLFAWSPALSWPPASRSPSCRESSRSVGVLSGRRRRCQRDCRRADLRPAEIARET